MKQFQTDIGVFYSNALSDSNGLDDFKSLYTPNYLRTNFQKLWNGPYITEETNIHSILGSYYIAYYRDDMSPCEIKGECIAFLALTEMPLETWEFINSYEDESLGEFVEKESTKHLTGKVRSLNLKSEKVTLLYKAVEKRTTR